MEKLSFYRSPYDFCLYIGDGVYLILFVDDAIITGEVEKIEFLLKALKKEFNIKDLGEVSRFLGMEVKRTQNELHISQPKIINRLLQEFEMNQCRSTYTPMEVNFQITEGEKIEVPYRRLVCSLMYLAVTTRPDLSYSVSFLSRYLDKPTIDCWSAAKRVTRYLSCTKTLGLKYKRSFPNSKPELISYSDADWAGDRESRKSVSGFVCLHASNPVAWHSKKQGCVALSSMEAEYIAAASTAQEAVNLKGVLSELSKSGGACAHYSNGECSEVSNNKTSCMLKVDNLSAIS